MKRRTELPWRGWSAEAVSRSGIWVRCPRCGGLGMVTASETSARFCCGGCGLERSRPRGERRCRVEGCCPRCGRYYRVELPGDPPFPVLNTACPHCGLVTPGRVQRAVSCPSIGEVRGGREPFFGLELWFLARCGGGLVWALNREHLAWLIDYLSAGLRPGGSRLPGFLKSAKARRRVVRCLERMQRR